MEWIKYVLESEIKRLNNCKNLSLKKLQNPQLEDTHVKHEKNTIEDCDYKIKEVSDFLKQLTSKKLAVCERCQKDVEEVFMCEQCETMICDKCSATYNQFSQIDFNCCKLCSEIEH